MRLHRCECRQGEISELDRRFEQMRTMADAPSDSWRKPETYTDVAALTTIGQIITVPNSFVMEVNYVDQDLDCEHGVGGSARRRMG